jgi:hypothetical protein
MRPNLVPSNERRNGRPQLRSGNIEPKM